MTTLPFLNDRTEVRWVGPAVANKGESWKERFIFFFLRGGYKQLRPGGWALGWSMYLNGRGK